MTKSVSVVMATYNGEQYIADQLKSIFSQKYLPVEIIISDDNSTDNTLNIIKEIIENYKRQVREPAISFTLIKNSQRLGFRDNFLQAARRARGDFIAFCDQDDVWHGNKLSACTPYFEDKTISLIVHPAYTIDKNSQRIGIFRQGIDQDRIRPPLSYDPWSTFWGFSMVFRRELLEIADIKDRFVDYIQPPAFIAHDRWIMFLAQMVGATAEIAECLADYRQHDSNVFGDGSKKKIEPSIDLIENTKIYDLATKKMVDIVEHIPESVGTIFPLYRKNASMNYLNKALDQLKMRADVYSASNRRAAAVRIVRGLAGGKYNGVHDRRIRWKSVGRDLQHSIRRP